VLGINRRQSTATDKRAIELSRWFDSSLLQRHRHHHHRHLQHQHQHQQLSNDDEDDDAIALVEWTTHAWTFDELVRLYSKKLPVIVRATRGYYGQPGVMQLDVGQV